MNLPLESHKSAVAEKLDEINSSHVDQDSETEGEGNLKEEILKAVETRFADMVQEAVLKYKEQLIESSSEDSAYQAALELGSEYYSKHKSERAKHRNFRKCKSHFSESF